MILFGFGYLSETIWLAGWDGTQAWAGRTGWSENLTRDAVELQLFNPGVEVHSPVQNADAFGLDLYAWSRRERLTLKSYYHASDLRLSDSKETRRMLVKRVELVQVVGAIPPSVKGYLDEMSGHRPPLKMATF